jgi:tRNA threonylcarbamoyladenosine biosynthesis protein TsaB
VTSPVVLAVDTAAPQIGAALWDGTLHTFSERVVRGADAALSLGLSELLGGAAGPPDLLAVSVGPGAFTSLRVGVAAALGLALSLDCRIVPFSSLEARARMVEGDRILALLDARKSRAYAALYERGPTGWLQVGEEQDLLPEDAIALAAGQPFLAVGEGAPLWQDLVEAAGGRVVEDAERSPAGWMAQAAGSRVDQALDAGRIQLRYLRAPDAKKPQPAQAG